MSKKREGCPFLADCPFFDRIIRMEADIYSMKTDIRWLKRTSFVSSATLISILIAILALVLG